jgi:hypothetical protein
MHFLTETELVSKKCNRKSSGRSIVLLGKARPPVPLMRRVPARRVKLVASLQVDAISGVHELRDSSYRLAIGRSPLQEQRKKCLLIDSLCLQKSKAWEDFLRE